MAAAMFLLSSGVCYAEEQGVPAAQPAPAAETVPAVEAVPAAEPAPAAQPAPEAQPAPADTAMAAGETAAAQPAPADTPGAGTEAPAVQPAEADTSVPAAEAPAVQPAPAESAESDSDTASGRPAENTAGAGADTQSGESAGVDGASESKDASEKAQAAALWYYYYRTRNTGAGAAADAAASKRKARKVLLTDEIQNCVEKLNTLRDQTEPADKKTEGAADRKPEKDTDTVEMIGEWGLTLRDERTLERLLKTTEKDGNHLGLVMIDIRTGMGIAVNADRKFYGASSIKGPFVVSLAAFYPQTLEKQKTALEAVAVNSDNGSYSSLVGIYGTKFYDSWREAVGAEAPLNQGDYANLSAEDLARLWLLNYQYITINPTYGEQVGMLFETPNRSAIHPVLGKIYKTQTKGGWIAERGVASADAGIVYAGEHPYILAIVSDYPANLKKMEPYVALMNKIHMELSGDRLSKKRTREYARE